MKTAVLLAAYNGSKYLPALLDSLRNQTDPDFFVIMQDDGSTDNTPEVLRSAAEQDIRFVFGSEQGQHLGAAGNFISLIRQARADRILLSDQDDLWEPDKIACLKQAMQEQENRFGAETPLLVHSDCSLINEAGDVIGESLFRHQGWDPAAVTLQQLLVQNNVTGCTLIMNEPLRRLVADHARAKELFMHDWFIALTAASFGRISVVDRPLTRYRQHAGNQIGASARSLPGRALAALKNRDESKRRILLTYTHTKVFRKLYGDELPPKAAQITEAYLATRQMRKIPRVLAVRRMGCVMQSSVTRMGQIFFG